MVKRFLSRRSRRPLRERIRRLPRLFSRARESLLALGENYADELPVFVIVSAVLAVPLTALVRVLQMVTVTSQHLWLAILGLLPGAALSLVSLGAVMWAFGAAKRAAARAYGIGLLASVLAPLITVESAAGIVTTLWRHGWITSQPGSVPGLWASERYFVWHTLNAVPFLQIDQTFSWVEPHELSGTSAGWVVVGLKVLLLLPLARMLTSVYWWLRTRESTARGGETEGSGTFAVLLAVLTVPTYACMIWLWPPQSALPRLLDDHVPASVDVLHQHIPLGWVTPTVQWLLLAGLLFLCALSGLGAIAAAFLRHDSIWLGLVAVLGVLLWLHLALVLAASTTMLFVGTGIAATTPPLPPDAPLTVGVGDQLWGFANAIPGLDITRTTHWVRPYVFTGWPAGAISIGFRMAAFVAILGLLWLSARLVRLARPRDEPAEAGAPS